jgi:hypothetical protein
MPSNKYVGSTSKGYINSHSTTNKSSYLAGGAVPLLLKNLIKTPIKGSGVNEQPKSNIMVGTITSTTKTSKGGELLNSMQNLKFGKGAKKRNESNIKFIF